MISILTVHSVVCQSVMNQINNFCNSYKTEILDFSKFKAVGTNDSD